jgi:hypothetical protein
LRWFVNVEEKQDSFTLKSANCEITYLPLACHQIQETPSLKSVYDLTTKTRYIPSFKSATGLVTRFRGGSRDFSKGGGGEEECIVYHQLNSVFKGGFHYWKEEGPLSKCIFNPIYGKLSNERKEEVLHPPSPSGSANVSA